MDPATLYLTIAAHAANLRPPPLAYCASAPRARFSAEMTPRGFILKCGIEVSWTPEARGTFLRTVRLFHDDHNVQALDKMKWWLKRGASARLSIVCDSTSSSLAVPNLPGSVTHLDFESGGHPHSEFILGHLSSVITMRIHVPFGRLEFRAFNFASLVDVDIGYTQRSFDSAWLSDCCSLRRLRLTQTSTDVSNIGKLSALEILELRLVRLDEGVSWLATCTKLRSLSLVECQTPTNSPWDAIGKLENLKALTLSSTNVDSLRFLHQLPQLSEVTFSECLLVRDWSPVGALSHLKKLVLTHNAYVVRTISWIHQCRELEEFVCHCNGNVEGFDSLAHLRCLKTVLIGCDSTLSMAFAQRLPQLKVLAIHAAHNVRDATCIREMANLTEIHWTFSQLTLEMLSGWCTCSALETLVIDDCSGVTDFSALGKAVSLKKLHLPDMPYIRRPVHTELPPRSRSLVSRLRHLILRRASQPRSEVCIAGMPSLTWIQHCNSLEEVTFGRYFCSKDWSSLGALQHLRSLSVDHTCIDTLAWVRHCPSLERLCVRDCPCVRDWYSLDAAQTLTYLAVAWSPLPTLACLGTHPGIETLDVSGCQLNDWENLRNFPGVVTLQAYKANINTFSWVSSLWKLRNVDMDRNESTNAEAFACLVPYAHRLRVDVPPVGAHNGVGTPFQR